MKKLVKLLSIVTMAAAGVFAIINAKPSQKAEVTEAAGSVTFSSGTIIYLDPSSFNPSNPWTGGYLGAWCWYKDSGAANDMWEEFSFDALSGKYYFKLSNAIVKPVQAFDSLK